MGYPFQLEFDKKYLRFSTAHSLHIQKPTKSEVFSRVLGAVSLIFFIFFWRIIVFKRPGKKGLTCVGKNWGKGSAKISRNPLLTSKSTQLFNLFKAGLVNADHERAFGEWHILITKMGLNTTYGDFLGMQDLIFSCLSISQLLMDCIFLDNKGSIHFSPDFGPFFPGKLTSQSYNNPLKLPLEGSMVTLSLGLEMPPKPKKCRI